MSPAEHKTSPAPLNPTRPNTPKKLGWWFWGSIFMLAAVTLALALLAAWRAPDSTFSAWLPQDSSNEGLAVPPAPQEVPVTRLAAILRTAQQTALEEARHNITPLLDQAYQPVFEAIPRYVDFHYSLKGEYMELSQAALGKMGSSLQDMLFKGLEDRLANTANQLDSIFDTSYRSSLQTQIKYELDQGGSMTPGPLTEQLLNSTLSRMKVSAPLGALVGVSTAAALKVAAQTLAVKLSAKAAAKAGSKAAVKAAPSVLGGAGTGTLLCGWAGPAAAGCAIAGGLLAWVGTDWLLIKADEHLHREEFEAELHQLVEEQQHAIAELLLAQLEERAQAVEELGTQEISTFTLRERVRQYGREPDANVVP